jgi:GTP-binding protein
LINALVNRKKLVRASSWPGRTQEINFFTLSDTIIFVDLPGYGYTRAPKGVSHNWQKGVHHYLKGSKNLTRVFLLLDSRRGARKSDMEMMAMLAELCISFQLVLTKSDKISATEQTELLDDLMMLIAKDFSTACPEIIATSTRGLRGIDQLRRGILPFIRRETFPDRLHKAFDNIRVYNPVSSTRII